jgi:hypothetical protein
MTNKIIHKLNSKTMKLLMKYLIILGAIFANNIYAQTVSTFDSLPLMENTYWNGSEKPFGTTFSSGNAIFPNYYDTSFGGFWSSGWSYSNKKDSTTAGFSNLFSAITAEGFDTSKIYAIGTQGSKIYLNSHAIGKVVKGLYITNSTYSALSMRNGDSFAKKFGGSSGNDEDWFKITVKTWHGGILSSDSVDFYLADFRYSDNSKDYIVRDWQWLDLSSLGKVDSLQFQLSSSDVGNYGMNTPAFFCIDNFVTTDSYSDIFEEQIDYAINIFPNPVSDYLNVDFKEIIENPVKIVVSDLKGRTVLKQITENFDVVQIPVRQLIAGTYILTISGMNKIISKPFVKK